MKIHTLKTWPEVFGDLEQGLKTFEVRRNDRNFKVGDTLVLQEFDPSDETYTGEMISFEITYILQGVFGLPKDLCVMSIRPLNQGNATAACWCWMMEYCKRRGIPPAEAWAWQEAKSEYIKYVSTRFRHPDVGEMELIVQKKDMKTPSQLYQELLMAVEQKFPGESRHETALRYIKNAENRCSGAGKSESSL